MKQNFWLLIFLGITFFTKSSYPILWHVGPADTAGDVGRYISVDGDYGPVVSYYDSTNGDLKVLGYGKIDTAGDVGKYTSIRIGRDSVWISYYDVTNGNLKYAVCKNIFEIGTIDSAGDVGLFTSIDVDTFGYPHISYYDATNKDLKYATWDGTNWNIERIDTAGDVGMYSSIGVDTISDSIYISYYDATNGDLKVAIRDGAGWNIQKLDTAGNVGQATCLRMPTLWMIPNIFDCEISYYDATNGDLKCARFKQGAWEIYIEDTSGDVGSFNCITRGKYYNFICCYDKINGNFREVQGTNIDTTGDVGKYCAGICYIEHCEVYYYDATNGDLKSAWAGGAIEENITTVENPNLKIIGNKIYLSVPNTITANLKLFDLCGRMWETLHSGTLEKGNYTFTPNIKTSGIYFVTLSADGCKKTKKLILLK